MLRKFVNKYIRKPGHLSDVSQHGDSKKFELLYGENPIGYLMFSKGLWHFHYSDWFKDQNRIIPLLEFPNKDKNYESSELWSFFSSRIPSKLNMEMGSSKKNNAQPNLSKLLENFGKYTVNNPFTLNTF